MGDTCFYCEKDERLHDLMKKIEDLTTSVFYLNMDQTHRGRSILALHHHKRELFELTPEELRMFTEDVAKAAKALQEAFQPQKINYAIYGDVVSHLHFHLVPKYENGEEWGEAFVNAPTHKKFMNEAEYGQLIKMIKDQL
ncbi:HIT family protein [Rossellomorea oryzaecorticis]|uniref:HIT family protein n=1 Tax=Rossellomorea oryzaecorticis TaxID=1396505 RepID=A0ABW8VSL2_9BACI